MIELNLIANGTEQKRIKEYLENNVSETLAEKINNGVKIVKDDKTLLNKKDLDSFWSYATEEARKISKQGARGAFVDDNTVFCWAIHYFEEDSIEGKLFIEDDNDYKTNVINHKPQIKPETKKKEEKKTPENQTSLFDMFDINKVVPETANDTKVDIEQETNYVDIKTGEFCSAETSFDKDSLIKLCKILDNKLEIK